MSAATKAIVRRYFEEVLSAGNFELIDTLISANYVSHYPAGYELGGGPEDVRQIVSSVRRAFPNVRFTVEDLIAEGEKVVCRWTFHGVQERDFLGIPASGRKATVMGIAIYRVVDEQIAEAWFTWDALGLMRQLDVRSSSDDSDT
jgi:steroid delta-isomerase-like uncharacterized protein